MDLTTDLVPRLPNGASVLPTIFDSGESLERVLVQIEERARSEVFDMEDEVSRRACASLAYKVSRSMSAIGDVGDKQAAVLRADWDAINVHRRTAKLRLSALRDKVREPLNAWQKIEADRVAAHEDRLLSLTTFGDFTMALGSAKIADAIDNVHQIVIDERWEEFEVRASEAKGEALAHLNDIAVGAAEAGAAMVELTKLRLEKEQRDEADRRDEERRKIRIRETAAADQARRKAQEEAATDLEAERDNSELEVREAKLRADRAEQDAREAVEREREEVAARTQAESLAQRKREADEAHRERIKDAASNAIVAFSVGSSSLEYSRAIIDAIDAGQIPHVTITY